MASIRNRGLATNQLKSTYRREVEVYLEGEDDLGIYKNYWFSHLIGKVAFKKAQEGDIPTPGCTGVEKNVLAMREAGVKAFGVIDRDAIQDMEHACEVDDARFVETNHQRNPYIYYTIRWELENYLVDAEVWEQKRVDAKTRGAGHRAEDEVAQELLAHCDVLIAHAAANIMRHNVMGKKKLGDGFGAEKKTRADFEAKLFQGPLSALTVEQRALYYHWVKKIEAFDQPHAPITQRLSAVCRRVHGKALLERFKMAHNIGDEIRFTIARQLSTKVPREIAEKITTWVDA